MTILRLALRSLLNNQRFSLLFTLNLSIGLLGFVGLDSFKRSFQNMLDKSSKELLSADLVVSARRPIAENERNTISKALPKGSRSYDMLTLYSMVSSPASERSQLVEIKAIEDSFPFYGSVTLENAGKIRGSTSKTINRNAEVWLSRDLSLSLAVKAGDSINIGNKTFSVADIVTEETAGSWAGASLAPRLYAGISQLESTGLIREGSTAWRGILVKLPEQTDPDELEASLFKDLQSPSIRVSSHNKASEQNGRILSYLSDYLGLVSLVAFFLSGLGALYLFRAYLLQKHKEIATLISLGLSHKSAITIYALQITILGLSAAFVSSFLVWFTLPYAQHLIESLTPVKFTPVFSTVTVIVASAMGALGTLTLCLPLFPYIRQLSPATLFQESYQPVLRTSPATIALSLPALAGFYGISVWQANSWLIGSLFFVILTVSCMLLILMGGILIRILAGLQFTSVSSRLARSYLVSQKLHATSSFLALGIGSLLINLIPQLENSILQELKQPEGTLIPSLFLFDIQDDQKEPLEKLLQEEKAYFQTVSPFIRGRLISINGKPFDKGDNEEAFSREAQREQRFRNRGVNLSYRAEFNSSETISEGRPFSGTYDWNSDQPAEISIEFRYADRLGISLGDLLVFDVQGMEILSKVISIRKVRWNSFQPNFFIQFQEGVLEDAPKTFLASIPPLKDEEKLKLQNKIAAGFPNVSAIDVTKLVDKLTSTIIQMSLVLKVMAWITIAAGLIVIFSIATHQTRQRLWDINLLKVLGASFSDIHAMITKEFAFLSISAAVFGGAAGLFASYIISRFIFEGIWTPSLFIPLASLVAITIMCVVVAQMAVRRTLTQKAAWSLRKND